MYKVRFICLDLISRNFDNLENSAEINVEKLFEGNKLDKMCEGHSLQRASPIPCNSGDPSVIY